MSIIKNIQASLDDNKFAAGLFVDLKKAFDTVDHYMLIGKLENYGAKCIARTGSALI